MHNRDLISLWNGSYDSGMSLLNSQQTNSKHWTSQGFVGKVQQAWHRDTSRLAAWSTEGPSLTPSGQFPLHWIQSWRHAKEHQACTADKRCPLYQKERVNSPSSASSMLAVHAHPSVQKSAFHHSQMCGTHLGPTPGVDFPQVINAQCEQRLLGLEHTAQIKPWFLALCILLVTKAPDCPSIYIGKHY